MPLDSPQTGSGLKPALAKRPSAPRTPLASDGDAFSPYDLDQNMASFRTRLHYWFRQIEKEFEAMYLENQNLQERVDMLNERMDRENCDKQNEFIEFDPSTAKAGIAKKLSSSSSQKLKTAHKLRAQTSKIVSSFKTPQLNCNLLKEFTGHKDGIWEVSVARPGQPIIGTASADHSACIWSVESTRCLLLYQGHVGSVNSIRFHPSRDLVLTGSGDCTAHIWHAAVAWDIPKGHSSEEELELGDDSDDLRTLGDSSKLDLLRTPVCEFAGHSGAVAAADWLSSADQVITASWDRSAILHDVETSSQVTTLSGHDLELTHTATHPAQKLAVTSSRDTTFRLWDFREFVHSVSVFQGHTESVTAAVFTGEDKVVSGSDDRTVKVWDLRNMRSPSTTIRVDSAVNRLAVSAAGVIAIPHDNRHVRLYDVSGQRLARLPRSSRQGHNRMVACASWTDDHSSSGPNLFTCGFDRRVLGWSVQSCRDV